MTKGILIRREGCLWDAEVRDLTFEEYGKMLEKFAKEEGADYFCPYIATRVCAGIGIDVWHDDNFLSYFPAPGMVETSHPGTEVMMGLLFICGADDARGESRDLTDDEIKKILGEYKVPDWELCQKFDALGCIMLGFKMLHYTYE